jgi:hypothetical protein
MAESTTDIDREYDQFFDNLEATEREGYLLKLANLEKDIEALSREKEEQERNYLDQKSQLLKKIEQLTIDQKSQPISPLPLSPPAQINYLYAIQSNAKPLFYRFGELRLLEQVIDNIHTSTIDHWLINQFPLHRVAYCSPTLNLHRDLKVISHVFQTRDKGNGWYELYDFEIQNLFHQYIIPKFNAEATPSILRGRIEDCQSLAETVRVQPSRSPSKTS